MKYSVDSLRPKLEHFLDPLLSRSGFELTYRLAAGNSAHPEVENPEVTVQFSGEDTDLLLANRAELLLALEHLAMESLRIPPEDHSLVSFDANDYRLLRIEELRMSAMAAADKVKKTHVPFHFNPMTSRERRVIHLALREEKDLRSESVGVGPSRAVVIVPADMPTPPAPPAPPRAFNRGPREGGGSDRGHRDSGDRGRRNGGGRPFRRDRNPRP
ncbi:MAG TPA: R3H domain-containing nucleic acid-binding protein [Bryobacteraceae bacterium]|jgi:spoIIIJ-associated protein|nr:R3H domain-containing nucleic acid-binding protein [Bryobacteraceae bacterium]